MVEGPGGTKPGARFVQLRWPGRSLGQSTDAARGDRFSTARGSPGAAAGAPVPVHGAPLDFVDADGPWRDLMLPVDDASIRTRFRKQELLAQGGSSVVASLPAPCSPPGGRVLPRLRELAGGGGAAFLATEPRLYTSAEVIARARSDWEETQRLLHGVLTGAFRLTPETQARWTEELFERFFAYLAAEGIQARACLAAQDPPYEPSPSIKIDTDGAHSINQVAAALYETLGVTLVVPPTHIIGMPETAALAFLHASPPLVWPGFLFFRDPGARFNVFLQHELRHVLRSYDVRLQRSTGRESKPSPFYGSAQGNTPSILGDLLRDGQQLDEVDTYAHTIRSKLVDALRAERASNADEARATLAELSEFVEISLEMASRAERVASDALQELSKFDNPPLAERLRITLDALHDRSSVTFGRLPLPGEPYGAALRLGGAEGYSLLVPLVESTGRGDAVKDRKLLEAQLKWTQSASNHYLSLYRVAQKAIDRAQAAASPKDRLTVLSALQKVLRLRGIERDPSAQTVDFAGAVRAFNAALKTQWERWHPSAA